MTVLQRHRDCLGCLAAERANACRCLPSAIVTDHHMTLAHTLTSGLSVLRLNVISSRVTSAITRLHRDQILPSPTSARRNR